MPFPPVILVSLILNPLLRCLVFCALADPVADHCIEVLRQGVMCNAEAKVNTYFWKTPTEIKGNTTGTRSCADWSRVQAWTNSRKVDFEGAGGEDFLHVLVPSDRNGSVGPL